MVFAQRLFGRRAVAGLLRLYFPAWLLCAVIGIVCRVFARLLLIVTGLAKVLPHQLLICVAVGVIAAILLAMLEFGL